jgi:hypothetical protein
MSHQKINTRKLIAYFGGRTPCHTLFTRLGVSISKKALEKWQERGSIPLNRVLQLAEADRKFNNRTLNLTDFLSDV